MNLLLTMLIVAGQLLYDPFLQEQGKLLNVLLSGLLWYLRKLTNRMEKRQNVCCALIFLSEIIIGTRDQLSPGVQTFYILA